ncbi:tetraacyldisaccharide 4'-kinase [Parashewanella curva]|uniref:Tetraacyldisaccharide 4'-kinase n=1 Tax=Parashewanella curva TaxID=2338552 RepID=A0A3L8PYQ2_9GAMM|nr:tetraacyldisaccharide 4'-kinase [Parashewanella curva]RLV59703.1 tetraacyldisaccharide 4'-kinase [Parashewanella curva]
MHSLVNKIWYQNHWFKWLLLPLSCLFWLVSSIRKVLFTIGLKKQYKSPVPVIVVGNITAGGSGKTPMVIHLIELLRANGYKPGVISRGYGAEFDGERTVTSEHTPEQVGDEPAMIKARTQVHMVVAAKRVKAAQKLIDEHDIDIIISDDGLQHYALERDIEIAIIDGERRLGNGCLIPAGPLRELSGRLQSVDFTVINGGSDQQDEFSMLLEPSAPVPLIGDNRTFDITQSAVAMAGIGNPQRFFDTLKAQGYNIERQIEFADHHTFSADELEKLSDKYPLIMTEKDAIKCFPFSQNNWWYLPVTARLETEFDKKLLDKLQHITA